MAYLLFFILAFSINPAFAEDSISISSEVERTLGPRACASCHKESTRAWKKTKHYKTYKEIPRKRIAKTRAKKMRFKQIKSNSLCVNCHFTSVKTPSRTKAVAGISCESCHGASKEWIVTHSDFGGRGIKANEETPEHKSQRLLQAESKGMIQLSNIYDLAKNCYRCHTVPEEKLVNIGRHPAGSDIELIQWGQGDVRHNVWHSENENATLPIQRLRVMYVMGKALDLEYAYRGLAKATKDATYFQHMIKRKNKAEASLISINALINDEEINAMLNISKDLAIKINNTSYKITAEKIEQLNRSFSSKKEASNLKLLDILLPDPSNYKGKTYHP